MSRCFDFGACAPPLNMTDSLSPRAKPRGLEGYFCESPCGPQWRRLRNVGMFRLRGLRPSAQHDILLSVRAEPEAKSRNLDDSWRTRFGNRRTFHPGQNRRKAPGSPQSPRAKDCNEFCPSLAAHCGVFGKGECPVWSRPFDYGPFGPPLKVTGSSDRNNCELCIVHCSATPG